MRRTGVVVIIYIPHSMGWNCQYGRDQGEGQVRRTGVALNACGVVHGTELLIFWESRNSV